jgi:hypothetical protein
VDGTETAVTGRLTIRDEMLTRNVCNFLRNIPEERRSHLRRGESLKSCGVNIVACNSALKIMVLIEVLFETYRTIS